MLSGSQDLRLCVVMHAMQQSSHWYDLIGAASDAQNGVSWASGRCVERRPSSC